MFFFVLFFLSYLFLFCYVAYLIFLYYVVWIMFVSLSVFLQYPSCSKQFHVSIYHKIVLLFQLFVGLAFIVFLYIKLPIILPLSFHDFAFWTMYIYIYELHVLLLLLLFFLHIIRINIFVFHIALRIAFRCGT
jgi:hypothetical protein